MPNSKKVTKKKSKSESEKKGSKAKKSLKKPKVKRSLGVMYVASGPKMKTLDLFEKKYYLKKFVVYQEGTSDRYCTVYKCKGFPLNSDINNSVAVVVFHKGEYYVIVPEILAGPKDKLSNSVAKTDIDPPLINVAPDPVMFAAIGSITEYY